jgi:hypothetical protein
MRSFEASNNLYVTTSAGVQVFSDISGSEARLAGAPRALNATYSLTGSTGFLDNGNQCAYRSTIQRTDAQNNVITGYPSQRLWVANSAGAGRNVALTIYLPSECSAGDVIQVYRTEQITGTTSDGAGDEMGLIYQFQLASADISTGSITFTDSVVDDLRGATLYTSPSEDGILQANDRPPVCKDLCQYKTFMLYANTETKQRLNLTLVGTTALGFETTADTHSNTTLDNVANVTNLAIGWKVEGTGIPAGTTISNIVGSTITLSQAATATATGVDVQFYTDKNITLSGASYSFGSTEITSGAGSPQVKVSVTGVAAVDIDLTARSLEYVVNRYTSNTSIYAYYTSGASDLPGALMFEERGLGANAFTVQASHASIQAMFYPQPPVSPSTTTQSTSSKDVRKNAVYVSKSQQNEHVPALNYLPVGPSNKEILRIVALKDSVIVVKQEGVYRITGDTFTNMTVTLVDDTVICLAPDSVAKLSNQVFMLCNQGIVVVSENGVEVISRDIEPTILPILASTSLSGATVGCGYESERSYFLSTLSAATDTVATQTLVYNTFTKTWVRHTYAFVAATVLGASDKIHFAKNSDTHVYIERKSYTDADYADPEFDATIVAIDGRLITFDVAGTTPASGWVISQGSTEIAVTKVQVSGLYYSGTLADTAPDAWVPGAASIYPSVGMDIEFHGFTGEGNPDILKQIRAIGVLTDDSSNDNSVTSLVASFRTNFDQNPEEVTITSDSGGWGAAWGSSPWGGGGDPYGYPTYVPRNKQYCTRMNFGISHETARQKLVITGIAFEADLITPGLGR